MTTDRNKENRSIDRPQNDITETLGFAMVLAFIGGMMDIYSYIVHGNVFATGQTGNLVLVAMHLAKRDYINSLYPLVPILSFWVGNSGAWHIFYKFAKGNHRKWKQVILCLEILILFLAGLIPDSVPDMFSNICVSFAASLQFCAFRKFDGENYASIFCTGNMRSCADNYYNGIVRKDKQSLNKAHRFSLILLAFFTGAVLCGLASKLFKEQTIWGASLLLLIIFIASSILSTKRLKLWYSNRHMNSVIYYK